MSPSNILDPSALIAALPPLLPSANTKLLSPQDGLVALIHTALTLLAFRLTAVNDNPYTSTGNILPTDWNARGPGHYAFKYRHEQSSLEFAITIAQLGSRTVINAIAVESDKVASLDVSTADYTSRSFYPFDQGSDSSAPLVHGFISSNRVADFVSALKLQIIQKLLPGLQKEGYSEGSETVSSTSTDPAPASQDPQPARPRPGPPPHAPYNDPYQPRGTFPSGNPLEIGRSDLDPFPRNPFAPPSLFPPGSGDGMFAGPEHPIFGSRGGRGDLARGPWGGDGYLPPLGAPPGARFDPVGPAFPNRPPGRGPFGPARRGQNPDNDEFMPPGMSYSSTNFVVQYLAFVYYANQTRIVFAWLSAQPHLEMMSNTMYGEALHAPAREHHNRPSQAPQSPHTSQLPLETMSSPPSHMRYKTNNVLPGFRPSPRKRTPIAEMSVRELQDLHTRNAKILSSPGASTSTYVHRITEEQRQIESRLLDLEGIDDISVSLRRAKLKGEGDMDVDEREPATSRTIEAKRRALAQYGTLSVGSNSNAGTSSSVDSPHGFTLQEAMDLERQAYLREQERQQRILEKKKRQGVPIRGEILSRQEQEARLMAFLTYKGSDDEEDDDDEDDDDEDPDDPASWMFQDEDEDGIKGQDIIEPDFEDQLSYIIQVDPSRTEMYTNSASNSFYPS